MNFTLKDAETDSDFSQKWRKFLRLTAVKA